MMALRCQPSKVDDCEGVYGGTHCHRVIGRQHQQAIARAARSIRPILGVSVLNHKYAGHTGRVQWLSVDVVSRQCHSLWFQYRAESKAQPSPGRVKQDFEDASSPMLGVIGGERAGFQQLRAAY